MRPVRHAGCNFVYRGPTPDIGDLHVQVQLSGVVEVAYELDDNDRALIAAGGRLLLGIWSQPIPPVSMQAIPEEMCRPVGEHPFKTIPELDDPERRGGSDDRA